jgi:hypothetical protein
MNELRECPFCGGEAEVVVCMRNEIERGNFGSDEVACVKCVQCGCRTKWYLHMPLAKARAMIMWQKRYEPPTPGGAIVPAGNERMHDG